jgi:hypothetical protein
MGGTATQELTQIQKPSVNPNTNGGGDLSDDEREADLYRSFMQKKRRQNKNAR